MRTNRFVQVSLKVSALLAASVLLFILYFLVQESIPLIKTLGVGAFFQGGWYPLEGEYSLTPMLLGSLYIAIGAVALAAPLGIVVAIFGQFYAPVLLGKVYRGMVELLSGIPSVVYGFWGLTVLVPWITNWVPPGTSVLAGIIVLAMMVLPLVVLTADSAISNVPRDYIRSAQALGLARWGIIYRLVLPVALPGILSGIMLQSGRALGETMAILMVTGNVVQLPEGLFKPVRTLTANIALEMAYAVDSHRVALFISGLLLLLMTVFIVSIAHYLKGRRFA